MKKLNAAFVILMSLGIVACGSSGGSGQSSTENQLKPSVTPDVNISDSSNSNSATDGTGGAYVVDVNSNIKLEKINAANADSIIVDGVQLTIRMPGIYAGGWMTSKIGKLETNVCCGKYSDAYIGGYETEDNFILYYNGNPTILSQIPQAGTATYSGNAIYFSTRQGLNEDNYKGTSDFTADFDAKTLNGILTFKDINTNIDIESNISGNSFTGTAKSNLDPSTTVVEGKFYGTNAKQLAGMASPSEQNVNSLGNSWSAAFIAEVK